jgi:hypothetical protein
MSNELTASEAVYGLLGWLTSRNERVVLSGRDDASIAVDLAKSFCEANNLGEPREGWHHLLTHPAT